MSFRGEPIPPESRIAYGGGTHFLAFATGVQIRGLYDGIAYWFCANCGHRWHRWTECNAFGRKMRKAVETTWAAVDKMEAGC